MATGFVGSGTQIKRPDISKVKDVNALATAASAIGGTGGAADAQTKLAKDYDKQVKGFRTNLPQFQENLFQGAVGQAKNQLAGQMADITSQSNHRGLLYGGLHEGANNEAKAGIAGQLGKQRLEINNLTQGLADQFENQQINQGLEKYRGDVDYNQQLYQQSLGRNAFENQQRAGALGLLGQGAAIAFSDENVKKNIRSGDESSQEVLDAIGNHKYEYKDSDHGAGTYLSPMAQELEKTEAGKAMVIDTPEGKAVDYGKGFGTIMALQSFLDKRLKKLEAR